MRVAGFVIAAVLIGAFIPPSWSLPIGIGALVIGGLASSVVMSMEARSE